MGPDFGQVRIEFDAAPCGERTERPDREAGQVSRPAVETRLTVLSRESPALRSDFFGPFPLLRHYCSKRYLCRLVSVEIV